MRDGVSPSRIVLDAGPWTTVADGLAARLRAGIDWRSRLAAGDVVDADGRPLGADAPWRPGQALWYWRRLPPEPRVPFELGLLHRDDDLVVVDKPHFLATLPGGRYLQETVLVRLRRMLGNDALVALHRLDRETAGVLLFSARPATRDRYHALLREQRVAKVYEAVAPFRPDLALPCTARHRLVDRAGAHHLPVVVADGEPNAETRIELLGLLDPSGGADATARSDGDEVRDDKGRAPDAPNAPDAADCGAAAATGSAGERGTSLAHYRLLPRTGRRHQLRVQLAALGMPIVGDRIYPRHWPEPAADAPPDYAEPLQLLAREVAFIDPVTGEPRRFVSGRRLARTLGA